MNKARCINKLVGYDNKDIWSCETYDFADPGDIISYCVSGNMYTITNNKRKRMILFSKDKFDKYFETISEAADECTVTKEELNGEQKIMREIVDKVKKPTTYKGWEIIKMISEGQIAEGTGIWDTIYGNIYTYESGDLFNEYDDSIDTNSLAKGEFKIIKPRKLVTFKKALYDNLKIRHKTWSDIEFTTPQNILNHYTKLSSTDILADLIGDSEVWEVECD